MNAYLDNSATTKVYDSVKDVMVKVMLEDYGNPSSLHMKGLEAENYVKDAVKTIAKSLKATEKEIIFTSGGTESNNMALIGGAMANKRRGNHIITTAIEHASVANPVKYLEEEGFRVTYLPVDHNGIVDIDALKEALCEETIIVSIMYVNNEIGAVEPIEEIGKIVKEYNPAILYHVDAIQAYGKYNIVPKKANIDLLSVSSHKIHGPKGVGFLYMREKSKVRPIILGGGQQRAMRSGTENVPGIAGMAQAVKEIYTDFDSKIDRMYSIREAFIEGVKDIEGVTINGKTDRSNAPHIVSVSFEGIRSEVLLHSLEDKNIYVSAGSACSSNKPSISATLKSIGIDNRLLDSTIRFSFSTMTTMEEIEYAIEELKNIVPVLRRYRAR